MYSEKSAAFIAEQILNIFKQTNHVFIKDETVYYVTPSIGIAMYPDCGTELQN